MESGGGYCDLSDSGEAISYFPRLAKPPRTAITDKSLLCIQHFVGVCYQPCLIHIDFRIKCNLKRTIFRIHKSSHCCPSFRTHSRTVLCFYFTHQNSNTAIKFKASAIYFLNRNNRILTPCSLPQSPNRRRQTRAGRGQYSPILCSLFRTGG